MNSNIDFKLLWKQQSIVLKPDVDEVIKKAKRLKQQTRNKLLLTNGLLALTIAIVVFISNIHQPSLVTTKMGITLIILAVVSYLLVANRMLLVLFSTHSETDSASYMLEMLSLRKKQEFLHHTILKFYFILLSAGIFLYMIEPITRMGLLWACFAMGGTFAWLIFNWFVLRPRTVQKQKKEWDHMINALEHINEQLVSGKEAIFPNQG